MQKTTNLEEEKGVKPILIINDKIHTDIEVVQIEIESYFNTELFLCSCMGKIHSSGCSRYGLPIETEHPEEHVRITLKNKESLLKLDLKIKEKIWEEIDN